ncbi:MAG TPA: hypothetical protein VEW69_02985 [Alphaproteobacteria bacterium]|nr:hypothetical protein [Alphaproteobacteria bacterium]
MRNWFVPAALLGICGVGLVFASERGRRGVQSLLDRMASTQDSLDEFAGALDEQLSHIQRTLDRLSRTMEGQS